MIIFQNNLRKNAIILGFFSVSIFSVKFYLMHLRGRIELPSQLEFHSLIQDMGAVSLYSCINAVDRKFHLNQKHAIFLVIQSVKIKSIIFELIYLLILSEDNRCE